MTPYTTDEVANLCRLPRSLVVRWFDTGRLQGYRIPGGRRRIPREDLISFLKEQGSPIPDELKGEER